MSDPAYDNLIHIDQLIHEDKWGEIEVLLNQLTDPQDYRDAFISLSALRLTWLYREFIPGWVGARDRIAQALKSQGYEIEKSMFGLL